MTEIPAAAAPEPLIAAERLRYSYAEGGEALRSASFRVADGERIVLLGSNGAGKTTLLKILNGLITPSAGEYRFAGQPVTRRTLADREFARRFRREVVYLFQNPDAMLFNPTVAAEIGFGPRQLGLADVETRVDRWARELQLEPLLNRPPFLLSGGEKQKVCLAALLALEPRVLLLDEPTAQLDSRSAGWLVDFLRDLAATTIISTHNLSLAAELGQRAWILSEDRELIYDGPLERALGDRPLLARVNLVHTHRQRHGETVHRHLHGHDWD